MKIWNQEITEEYYEEILADDIRTASPEIDYQEVGITIGYGKEKDHNKPEQSNNDGKSGPDVDKPIDNTPINPNPEAPQI
jgi:hypothetical protein